MQDKILVNMTTNRRLSIPPHICSLLKVGEGSTLELSLDTRGEETKLVLMRYDARKEKNG